MVRRGVSGLAARIDRGPAGQTGRRKKAAPGLRVVERDGFYHLSGTVRAGGSRRVVRKSTGLQAVPENRDAAEAIRLETERQFRDLAVHGKHPSVPVAIAAERFLNRAQKPVGPIDQAKIRDITRVFGFRLLADITDQEWNAFVDRRLAGRAPATRERYLNLLVAFLNWCRGKGRRWLAELPEFERNQDVRKPRHRRARRVADLSPALIELMIDNAAPHLAGQMAAYWATGGRVSSVIYGCRLCDYVAAEGREQLTYHETKNGDPVTAAFHPAAAQVMRRYLEWRGRLWDREAPLFLTHRREAYRDNDRAFGGQVKTAWHAMQRRTIAALRHNGAREAAELRRRGERAAAVELIAWTRDQCNLVGQVTPHWFRHHLATFMLSHGADVRSVMEQGGWRDLTSVMGYTHDVPERRRAHVDQMAVDTSFARGQGSAAKPVAISRA